MTWDQLLPLVFMTILGVALLLYVILDGYDLGVGMLMHRANSAERDTMVASIGPYWDANETWLVLAVGILLVAFPRANALISGELYLPMMFMLVGLILRGAAFDFRVKAQDSHRVWWNRAFIFGSFLASAMQGWMLGRYVVGFAQGSSYLWFAVGIAVAVPAVYTLLGACWLIIKTDSELQVKAVKWAKQAWWPVLVGMVLISLATPWVSETVSVRWFTLPNMIGLLPIPVATTAALVAMYSVFRDSRVLTSLSWVPMVLLVLALFFGLCGLAFSLYPYIVLNQLTMWQAASAPDTLQTLLVGVCLTIPVILLYTVFAYWVFRGKVQDLSYG